MEIMKLMGANECLSPASRNIVDDAKIYEGFGHGIQSSRNPTSQFSNAAKSNTIIDRPLISNTPRG